MVKGAMKWYTRAAMIYAFGVWTMVGSYALFNHLLRPDMPVLKKEEQKEHREDDKYEYVVREYSDGRLRTVASYKKESIPDHIINTYYLKPFSSFPETGDRNK